MMTPDLRNRLIRGHVRRYLPSTFHNVIECDPKRILCIGNAAGKPFFRVRDVENGSVTDWQLRGNRLRCIGERNAIF